VLLLSALGLGFLHGLGADHLMGIAALSIGSTGSDPAVQRARAFNVAVKFAIGHALLLGLGAGGLILLGWSLPVLAERGGEMLGGGLLIVLGAVGLWGAASGAIYGHTHVHSGETAAHWHLHLGHRHPAPAAHSHVPTIIGAAFAVSSLRALTLLAPFGSRIGGASLPLLLLLVVVFALGILLSMSLFGVAFARVLSTGAVVRLGRASAVLMAGASVLLGGYWVLSAI
jgi:nickel/cobalt exporter